MSSRPRAPPIRSQIAFEHKSAAPGALVGRRRRSDRFILNAQSSEIARAPTGGTAKVVRLPFMDESEPKQKTDASATYIVGVAGMLLLGDSKETGVGKVPQRSKLQLMLMRGSNSMSAKLSTHAFC